MSTDNIVIQAKKEAELSYENVNTTSIVLLTFEDGDSAAVSTSEAEEKIQDKKTEGVELVSRQIVM